MRPQYFKTAGEEQYLAGGAGAGSVDSAGVTVRPLANYGKNPRTSRGREGIVVLKQMSRIP